MKIFFGTYSFKIKSYLPQEVQLPQEEKNKYRLELRQSFFHFCFIPLVPLGKIWRIRRNGYLFEPNAPMKAHLKNYHNKISWMAFMPIPIIIFIYLFVTNISEIREWNNERKLNNINSGFMLNPMVKDRLHISNKDGIEYELIAVASEDDRTKYIVNRQGSYNSDSVESYWISHKELKACWEASKGNKEPCGVPMESLTALSKGRICFRYGEHY